MTASFTIPLRVENTSNKREHWRARSSRIKKERAATRLAFIADAAGAVPPFPVVVEMTRGSAGTLDDDGLCASLKAVRDEVAACLGCGDSPRDPVQWRYAQEKRPRGVFDVTVRVTSAVDNNSSSFGSDP